MDVKLLRCSHGFRKASTMPIRFLGFRDIARKEVEVDAGGLDDVSTDF